MNALALISWRQPLGRNLLYLALAVLALNVFDAMCTLRHVELGASELNPLMDLLLRQGATAFFIGKYALASGGILGIVACSHHPLARGVLAWLLVPVYAAIALWHGALFLVVS